jgi:hypothetical protein
MKYKLEFQYLQPGRSRPVDYVQEEQIAAEDGSYIPIPDVGDSVILRLEGDRNKAYKVVTRNFAYIAGWWMVHGQYCCDRHIRRRNGGATEGVTETYD